MMVFTSDACWKNESQSKTLALTLNADYDHWNPVPKADDRRCVDIVFPDLIMMADGAQY